MQVICDVDKHITAFHVRCPGSRTDSAVYKRMALYQKPLEHFSPGEYILADSAYMLSRTCIPAYKAPAANHPENMDFNYCLTKARVRNEHCIGILKSRWGSLREMRNQIRSATDMLTFVNWVIVCCVLHNMLAHLGDAWAELYLEEDMADNVGFDGGGEAVLLDAETFRETLKRTTIETNYMQGILPR